MHIYINVNVHRRFSLNLLVYKRSSSMRSDGGDEERRFGQIDTYRELVKEYLLADLVFCREPVRARVFVISRV